MKTDGYAREQVAKVVQLDARIEGLKLGEGVVDGLSRLRVRSPLSGNARLRLGHKQRV